MAIDKSGRQNRVHTCFKNCKDYIYDQFKDIYTMDNRKNCTDLEPEEQDSYLFCLYPDDPCEKTIFKEEVTYRWFTFAPWIGLIAMVIA
mmetsp:Transcript_31696/g.48543  ORF Transcript_31696/g.48543 Transcript_31696/m.48543 type:complete len:89 (-) Transcript_31696:2142-2408(-)